MSLFLQNNLNTNILPKNSKPKGKNYKVMLGGY
jgi:hypothetical protein